MKAGSVERQGVVATFVMVTGSAMSIGSFSVGRGSMSIVLDRNGGRRLMAIFSGKHRRRGEQQREEDWENGTTGHAGRRV